MRRAVVLSGGSPLGRRLTEWLGRMDAFESVTGIEPSRFDSAEQNEGLEFISWSPDHRRFAEYLVKENIDTVVDCGLVADRSGGAQRPSGADVISAMYVGAAISDDRSTVRSWVLASSSAFYQSQSYMPLFQSEDQVISSEADDRATSIAEAEEYARSVARRQPYVNVAILRLQEIIGRDCLGPLAGLLSRPVVPRMLGFDPPTQFLHVDDAVSALAWAASRERAGLYNVASHGMVRWGEAIRSTGRPSVPILPISVTMLEPAFERLGIPFVHSAFFDLLRYGMIVDTAKITEAGWKPEADQVRCLEAIA